MSVESGRQLFPDRVVLTLKEKVHRVQVFLDPALSQVASVAQSAFSQSWLLCQLQLLLDSEQFVHSDPHSSNLPRELLQCTVHGAATEDHLEVFKWCSWVESYHTDSILFQIQFKVLAPASKARKGLG